MRPGETTVASHGHVHWNELNTHDAERAKAFYGNAMGWSFERMDMMDGAPPYWVAKAGDATIGGIFTMSGPDFEGVPDHWLTHFDVQDIDAKLDEARGNGATVLREPWDMPGVGRIAIVRDPGGAVTGWIQPSEPVR